MIALPFPAAVLRLVKLFTPAPLTFLVLAPIRVDSFDDNSRTPDDHLSLGVRD